MKFKSLPKIYRLPMVALIACVSGAFVFGWQNEIITIWISQGIYHFEFPFYLEKLFGFENGVSVWWARDFWYAELGLSILVGLWGAYQMGARVVGMRLRKNAVAL